MTLGESFKKKERLLKKSDFIKVYRNGSSAKKHPFAVYRLENNLGYNRFGVSISSKVIRRAVGRNKIKRILREIFRRNKVKFGSGRDIIIKVVRDLKKPPTYKEIESLIFELTRRVGTPS